MHNSVKSFHIIRKLLEITSIVTYLKQKTSLPFILWECFLKCLWNPSISWEFKVAETGSSVKTTRSSAITCIIARKSTAPVHHIIILNTYDLLSWCDYLLDVPVLKRKTSILHVLLKPQGFPIMLMFVSDLEQYCLFHHISQLLIIRLFLYNWKLQGYTGIKLNWYKVRISNFMFHIKPKEVKLLQISGVSQLFNNRYIDTGHMNMKSCLIIMWFYDLTLWCINLRHNVTSRSIEWSGKLCLMFGSNLYNASNSTNIIQFYLYSISITGFSLF